MFLSGRQLVCSIWSTVSRRPLLVLLLGLLLLLGVQEWRHRNTLKKLEQAQGAALTAEASLKKLTVFQGVTTDAEHRREAEEAAGVQGVDRADVTTGRSVAVVGGHVEVTTEDNQTENESIDESSLLIRLTNQHHGTSVVASIQQSDGEVNWQNWRFDEEFRIFYERYQAGAVSALDLRLTKVSRVDGQPLWERPVTVDNVSFTAPTRQPRKPWVFYADLGWTPQTQGYYALVGIQRQVVGPISIGASVFQSEDNTTLGIYAAYTKAF